MLSIGLSLTSIALRGSGAPVPPWSPLSPLLVERFSTGGSDYRVPANVRTGLPATTMTGGGYLYAHIYPVTGTQGDSHLTCSDAGLAAGLGGAPWSGTLKLPDGAILDILIKGDDGAGRIDLWRPLPLDVPAGSELVSTYENANGQHRTQYGNRAEAQKLAAEEIRYAQRVDVHAGVNYLTAPNGAQTIFAKNASLASVSFNTNGISSAGPLNLSARNIVDATHPPARPGGINALLGRGIRVGLRDAGHGLTGTGDLPDAAGFVELYPEIKPGTVATDASLGRVRVYVSSPAGERLVAETMFDRLLTRVRADFEAADTSYRIEVEKVDSDVAWDLGIAEFRVFSAPASGAIFPTGSKIVCLMDSWGAFHNGAFADELATRLPGRTVVNHSLGGMTIKWALAWFDEYVVQEGASHCIVNFCINDANAQAGSFLKPDGSSEPLSMGATSDERRTNWLLALSELSSLAFAAGVRLVILMPPGTASQSQAQNLQAWSAGIYGVEPVPQQA